MVPIDCSESELRRRNGRDNVFSLADPLPRLFSRQSRHEMTQLDDIKQPAARIDAGNDGNLSESFPAGEIARSGSRRIRTLPLLKRADLKRKAGTRSTA